EAGADAPRWNSAVTVSPIKPGSSAPVLQSAVREAHSDGPMPWSAPQSSGDPSRSLAAGVGSKATSSPSAATAANANGPTKWDNPPAMSTRYPLREAMADRAPARVSTPAWPPTDYRSWQAPDPSAGV